MSSPEKQKGDRAERAVVEFLNKYGLEAHRIRAGSPDDIGDIDGIDDTAIQVKHWNDITAAITQGITQLTQNNKTKKHTRN